MSKAKPRKNTQEFRKIRYGYVKKIMRIVRRKVDIGRYVTAGPVIALVMFDIEGQIDVALYRDHDRGNPLQRFSGNTRELWADKKMWAYPFLTRKGNYKLTHRYVSGKGLSYNEANLLGKIRIESDQIPPMRRLKHFFK